MKKTIFIKLMGTYFIIIFLCIGIVGISLSFMFKDYLYNQKENELVIKGKDIAQLVKPLLVKKEDPHDLINLINRSDLNLGTEVWVTDKKGLVIAAAANHEYCEGNALEETEYKEMQSGKIAIRRGLSLYYQGPVIRVTVPISLEKDKVIGALIIYSPILGIKQAFSNITKMISYSGIFSLVVALIVGIFMSQRISKPILNMADAAIAIAKGEKKVEVNTETGLAEINQLGKTFNYMSGQIEENEERMKDFVANVSHELRSPLTSIKGFAEALIDNKGKNDEARIKYLNIINKEADRLSTLVTDLLTLSKGENVLDPSIKEKIDLEKFINSVILNLKELAEDKGIAIQVMKADLPFILFAPNALSQVLLNLLENAINYSPKHSRITIYFKVDEHRVRVSIKDEGVGIPDVDLPYIWERFYRVDKARSRETGGTGLGLSIVKQLVAKNQGELEVESKLGQGSIFSFTLPIA